MTQMTQIAQIFICRRWVSSDSHVDGDWGVGLDRFTITENRCHPAGAMGFTIRTVFYTGVTPPGFTITGGTGFYTD